MYDLELDGEERNLPRKYYFYSGIKTKDVKAAIYKLCEPGDMEFRTPYNHLREIKVMVGNGVKFDDGDYDIQAHFGVPWVDDMMSWKYFALWRMIFKTAVFVPWGK